MARKSRCWPSRWPGGRRSSDGGRFGRPPGVLVRYVLGGSLECGHGQEARAGRHSGAGRLLSRGRKWVAGCLLTCRVPLYELSKTKAVCRRQYGIHRHLRKMLECLAQGKPDEAQGLEPVLQIWMLGTIRFSRGESLSGGRGPFLTPFVSAEKSIRYPPWTEAWVLFLCSRDTPSWPLSGGADKPWCSSGCSVNYGAPRRG